MLNRLALLSLFLLALVSGSPARDTTLVVWGIGEGEGQVGFFAAVEAFERANPGVRVSTSPSGGGQNPQKMLTAIVGVRAFGIARPLFRYVERLVSHDAAKGTISWKDPKTGDLYETPVTPGTTNPPYLVLDPLSRDALPSREQVQAVMRALGYRPVDLPGTPVRALAFAAQRLPRFIAQPALTRALGSGRGDKMPSFHIDLHSGRGQTEVRFLNGAVARLGAAHGVPTPVNTVLTTTLEALSAGRQSVETFRRKPEALLALLG